MTIIQVIQTLTVGLLQKLETTHRKYSEQQQFSLDNPIQFNSVVKCEFKLKSERESKAVENLPFVIVLRSNGCSSSPNDQVSSDLMASRAQGLSY